MAVRLTALLRRNPALSHEEFAAHWRDVHGPLMRSLPGIAAMMDRLVTIRTLVGSEGRHAAFQCLTGWPVDRQPAGGWPSFGSIVSRNESIIYGAQGIAMNHDERLSGRGSSESGFETPITWEPVRVVWESQGTEALPSGTSHDPDAIAVHYTQGASS